MGIAFERIQGKGVERLVEGTRERKDESPGLPRTKKITIKVDFGSFAPVRDYRSILEDSRGLSAQRSRSDISLRFFNLANSIVHQFFKYKSRSFILITSSTQTM